MYKAIQYLLLFSSCVLFSLIATAQDTVDNDKLSCTAKHLDTEKEVDVNVISSIPGKKIATAQWPLGYPTIAINDSEFVKLPKHAKEFVYFHECAHLKFISNDEDKVDCESVNLLAAVRNYTEIDIRKLIQTLTQEFGWSKRWEKLLDCRSFNGVE